MIVDALTISLFIIVVLITGFLFISAVR